MSKAIHKAVELADGWSIVHIYDGEDWAQLFEDDTGVPTQQILLQDVSRFQGSLAALTAQLAKQVDAIHPEMLTVWSDLARLRTGKNKFFSEGQGRIMNTINVIVDSGILE